MGIDVERNRHAGVTQPLRDYLRMDVLLQKQSRVGNFGTIYGEVEDPQTVNSKVMKSDHPFVDSYGDIESIGVDIPVRSR